MKRRSVGTRRLLLRPLQAKDYQAWLAVWAKGGPAKDRWDHGPLPPRKCSRKHFEKLRARHAELARNDDYYFFGLFERKTGALVGHVDFDVFLRSTHQFANFGYLLHHRYWGKGYGIEAARAALRLGFQQLKLQRLEASIDPANRRSIRLAQRIGMRREGIKRRYWFEEGEWKDQLVFVANPPDLGLPSPRPF